MVEYDFKWYIFLFVLGSEFFKVGVSFYFGE